MTFVRTAPAKFNLCLRVHERRPDGYHNIDSIFLPLPTLADTLFLEQVPDNACHVICSDPDLSGSGNILHKAWENFCAAVGSRPGVKCRLIKRIPCGSGLGGGSSDAATFLKWLSSLPGSATDSKTLLQIASRTGADVPFFLLGVPARVTGIGEIVEPLESVPVSGYVLLVCPPIRIDTCRAYAALDIMRGDHGSTLTKKNVLATQKTLSQADSRNPLNDFEMPVFAAHPQLAQIKKLLLQAGGRAAMSGSGSALFGLFDKLEPAQVAAEEFASSGLRVHLASL